MIRRKMTWMACVAVLLALASAGYSKTVKVSDFESGLGTWAKADGTISLSTATGSQAMLVEAPSGWKNAALMDAKAFLEALGHKGATISLDVTVFPTDMATPGWFQLDMVINGQNNDDNGANNNINWNQFDLQNVTIDGQPHTISWVVPDSVTAKVAGADQNIGWFQLFVISNSDIATKFYVDNVQISYPSTTTVVMSDFETGLDGWGSQDGYRVGVLSLSATGATSGKQAMLVEGPGGWQQMAKIALKPFQASLGNKGVSIAADVTAFPADMTTTWMQVGFVVNADGAIGWKDLGTQGVALDGLPHTITWVVPDSLADLIAQAPDTLAWFELLIISNLDGASKAKFYIDNIRILGVPGKEEGEIVAKSTDLVIGNFEEQMDGWVVGAGIDARYSDHNGVTLGKYSLDVYQETGAWNDNVLVMDLLDPNNAAVLEAFKNNTKLTLDVTRLVVDWPTDDPVPWNEILFLIEANGDGWNMWTAAIKQANWTQTDGDKTLHPVFDYAPFLSQIQWGNVTQLKLHLGINANSADYAGWVWFYLDNIKLVGGGVTLNPQPAIAARDVSTKTKLSWGGGTFAQKFNVYLGTDRTAVLAANGAGDPNVTFATVDVNSFDPNGLLYGTQYFWRVDAINDVNPDSPWTGTVWEFTTAKFDVVDDFESYTNDSPNRLFQIWRDGAGFSPDEFFPQGYTGNGTGSLVGKDPSFGDIMEKTNPHSGTQAFIMVYDNKDKKISEAVRTWAEPQTWNCDRLTIWTRGLAANGADTLYITIKDGAGNVETETNADASILTDPNWTEWSIPASDFTLASLGAVVEMTIGVGSLTSPKASAGTLFVDDIRTYPRATVSLDADALMVPLTATAPVIDGKGDDVAWSSVSETKMLIWDMSNTTSAEPENAADLSAGFKAMYDATNFYLFLQVQDSVIDTTFSDWQGDGLEVYFDGDYSHGDAYDGVNDNQIRITVQDLVLADTQSTLPVPGMQFKVLRVAGGYNIEVAIPLAELQIAPGDDPAPLLDSAGKPIPGTDINPANVIGFEMQINDNDDGTGRQTMLRWFSDDNGSYGNASLFGQARLLRK